MVKELLERHVALDHETVPDGPLKFTGLLLGAGDGLGEAEEGECKIDEAVLVRLDVLAAVDELQDLEADKTRNDGGCGRDGGDDLASNTLGL